MMYAFDPDLRRQLDALKEMVSRQGLTPTREWPLLVFEDEGAVFVVREWPNGAITSYVLSRDSS